MEWISLEIERYSVFTSVNFWLKLFLSMLLIISNVFSWDNRLFSIEYFFLCILKEVSNKSEMKSNESFDSIWLNNSEASSEITLSFLLWGSNWLRLPVRIKSWLFRIEISEISLLAKPFEIISQLGENYSLIYIAAITYLKWKPLVV